jgi:hypothetical protein
LTVARLMCFIAMMEGFFRPGTLPARCHNPGALVYKGQPHATRAPGPTGYACFDTDSDGWNALKELVEKKLRRGSLKRAWPYLEDQGARKNRTVQYSARPRLP